MSSVNYRKDYNLNTSFKFCLTFTLDGETLDARCEGGQNPEKAQILGSELLQAFKVTYELVGATFKIK